MLPPEIGIPVVRREVTVERLRGEVVVGGALGVMLAELDRARENVAAKPRSTAADRTDGR